MTLGTDLEDVLKKYGLNSHVVSANIDHATLDVEIAVYDKDGNMMIVGNDFLTTYIEIPLSTTEPLIKSIEVGSA